MLERSPKDTEKNRELQPHGRQFMSPMTQMDRMFDEFFKRPFFSLLSPRMSGGEMSDLYLPVDIYEDAEAVVVKAEIPGVKKEDLDIQLTADSITISGRKSSEEKVEQKDYLRVERSYGSFTRRFQLPVETITDKARASFKDGVLEVKIPKSTTGTQRAQKITVE